MGSLRAAHRGRASRVTVSEPQSGWAGPGRLTSGSAASSPCASRSSLDLFSPEAGRFVVRDVAAGAGGEPARGAGAPTPRRGLASADSETVLVDGSRGRLPGPHRAHRGHPPPSPRCPSRGRPPRSRPGRERGRRRRVRGEVSCASVGPAGTVVLDTRAAAARAGRRRDLAPRALDAGRARPLHGPRSRSTPTAGWRRPPRRTTRGARGPRPRRGGPRGGDRRPIGRATRRAARRRSRCASANAGRRSSASRGRPSRTRPGARWRSSTSGRCRSSAARVRLLDLDWNTGRHAGRAATPSVVRVRATGGATPRGATAERAFDIEPGLGGRRPGARRSRRRSPRGLAGRLRPQRGEPGHERAARQERRPGCACSSRGARGRRRSRPARALPSILPGGDVGGHRHLGRRAARGPLRRAVRGRAGAASCSRPRPRSSPSSPPRRWSAGRLAVAPGDVLAGQAAEARLAAREPRRRRRRRAIPSSSRSSPGPRRRSTSRCRPPWTSPPASRARSTLPIETGAIPPGRHVVRLRGGREPGHPRPCRPRRPRPHRPAEPARARRRREGADTPTRRSSSTTPRARREPR